MSDEMETVGWTKPITMEVAFTDVDPEALGLLTGGVMGTMPESTFSIAVNYPVKRTFWQWLRRKPKQWHRVVVPNARLATEESE